MDVDDGRQPEWPHDCAWQVVVAFVVEENDIGARVADALQKCGYEVPRILLAADVIPSHPEWTNRMRGCEANSHPWRTFFWPGKTPDMTGGRGSSGSCGTRPGVRQGRLGRYRATRMWAGASVA
jgi:hypothetical protein